MKAFIATFLVFSLSTQAFAQDFATYYGDGLRFYAEGRYPEALEQLYRAYAHTPSATVMRLIIRTHDFSGHCSAVEKQLGLFTEVYPKESVPAIQRCAAPGTVRVECATHVDDILINHSVHVRCGAMVKLPPGDHTIHSETLNESRVISITSGEMTVAQMVLVPTKWHARVDVLNDPRPYTLIKTKDGLFEIWVRSGLRDDPDMNHDMRVPGYTILRSTDDLYDISSDSLKPVESSKPQPRQVPRFNIPVLSP